MNRIPQRVGGQCRHFRPAILATGVVLLGVTLPPSTTSWAQEKKMAPLPIVPDLAPMDLTVRTRFFMLRLKNVTASEMAFWLDPANHAATVGAKQFQPKGDMVLPKGVEQIIAVDPQNTLLVKATEESFRELEAMVAKLDKSERQVEIDSQLWRVKNTSLTPELVKLLQASDGKTTSNAVLPDEIADSLRKLRITKEAQLLTAPQFVIGENLYFNWQYSVRNLQPEVKPSMPNVWRFNPDFHSDMPTIKPQPTDPEFTMPNVAKRLSKMPTSVYLQIAPTVLENGQIELSVMGANVGEPSNNVLNPDQTLFLFLPQGDATDRDSKTFLLLKPQLNRSTIAPAP